MAQKPLENMDIHNALRLLGEQLEYHTEVKITLVGGAAGMLSGNLSPQRTTLDCDVVAYDPDEAMGAVELTAEKVAIELGLPTNWLNSDVSMQIESLPEGWMARRNQMGTYGRLSIYVIDRKDLLVMKFYAGRPQDLEDIEEMKPGRDELVFVRESMELLRVQGCDADQIADASDLLSSMLEMKK